MSYKDTPPPTIADEGLRNYLNRTRERHDGLGYNDFVRMIAYRDNHSSKAITLSGIGKLFRVDYRAIKKWLSVYYAEKGVHHESKAEGPSVGTKMGTELE